VSQTFVFSSGILEASGNKIGYKYRQWVTASDFRRTGEQEKNLVEALFSNLRQVDLARRYY
jgi:hypothetical protein